MTNGCLIITALDLRMLKFCKTIVHFTRVKKHSLRSFDTTLIYIPPYSPTLAPVELIFGYLKKKFAAQNKHDKVNLNSKDADMMLFNALKLVD